MDHHPKLLEPPSLVANAKSDTFVIFGTSISVSSNPAVILHMYLGCLVNNFCPDEKHNSSDVRKYDERSERKDIE